MLKLIIKVVNKYCNSPVPERFKLLINENQKQNE